MAAVLTLVDVRFGCKSVSLDGEELTVGFSESEFSRISHHFYCDFKMHIFIILVLSYSSGNDFVIPRNDTDDGPLPANIDTIFVAWRCSRTGVFKMRWPSSGDPRRGSGVGKAEKSAVTVRYNGKLINNRLDYTVFMYDGARLEDGDCFVFSCSDICGRK